MKICVILEVAALLAVTNDGTGAVKAFTVEAEAAKTRALVKVYRTMVTVFVQVA